jgi:23S rRNA pseudouridine1911/1915/1917 synthase
MRQIRVRIKPKQPRLDKYLAANIKSLTRSKIKKLIKEGFISVNEKSVDPDYEIKKGDAIKIEIPPPKPTKISPEAIPLKIVFEDSCLLVIDKEAGMVVHPTLDHPAGTLVNAILHHLKKVPGLGETLRPGIVHRLDKDTSGLLVVAAGRWGPGDGNRVGCGSTFARTEG